MNETHQATANLTTRSNVSAASRRERQDSPNWGRYAAYAACAWAIVFAIPNLYGAAGGTWGVSTIGGEVEQRILDRDATMVATLWITGLIKVAGAIFALALVREWGHRIPRRLMIVLGWGGGLTMILYGAALIIQHALMLADIVDPPELLDTTALRWHLFFWDLFWLFGGVLFALASWYYMRGNRGSSGP